jgi:RNA polymerase sigma factor (sigma-70 family)
MNPDASGFVPNPSTNLLLLVRNGQAGRDRLTHLVQPACERWLRTKGTQPHDVHDITQETLLKIHAAIDSYDKSRKFGSWVFTILYRTWVDHHRKNVRHQAGGGSDHFEQLHQQSDPIEENQFDTLLLAEALTIVEREVPTQRWHAFRRVKLDGASYETVAAETERSLPAIYADIHQVMTRLRDLMCE